MSRWLGTQLQSSGVQGVQEFKEFRSSGVQEFRSSGVQGVQEFTEFESSSLSHEREPEREYSNVNRWALNS
jgi:hypothetical protein